MIAWIGDFFVAHGFVLELVLAAWVYCHYYERRENFAIRAAVAIGVLLLNSALWHVLPDIVPTSAWITSAMGIAKYVLFFLIGYGSILFCLKCERQDAWFCMTCAQTTQHLSYSFYDAMMVIGNWTYDSLQAVLLISATMLLMYTAAYYLFVRKMKQSPEMNFRNQQNMIVGGLLILSTIVIKFLMEPYLSAQTMKHLYVLIRVNAMISCAFALMLEQGLFRNQALTDEKNFLTQLVHMQEEQYRTSKANVEMVNIKCHDMKHQISHITSTTDPDAIRELEQIISVYDSSLQTGNEILDVCLMEKKLLCEKNSIKLDCIANGQCLSFMQPSDLFSMFGNALDNAMEAVCKLDDVEKRIIFVSVKEELGMAIIHVENNYTGELIMADGIPRTSKGDEFYHGYGVKSIRMVVEKYDGNMALLPQNGIFNLNITIPVPEG